MLQGLAGSSFTWKWIILPISRLQINKINYILDGSIFSNISVSLNTYLLNVILNILF